MWADSWRKLKAEKSIVFETVHQARDGRIYPGRNQGELPGVARPRIRSPPLPGTLPSVGCAEGALWQLSREKRGGLFGSRAWGIGNFSTSRPGYSPFLTDQYYTLHGTTAVEAGQATRST